MLGRREFMVGTAALAVGAGGLPGCASGVLVHPSTPTTLHMRYGMLQGRRTPDGVDIFRGVPYASPPLGPRRFRAPEPPKPWTTARSAFNVAPMAMQSVDGRKSEDCLYLNIWTPSGPGPHPVYVWMHAGGNIQGRASDPRYNGLSFAREGVVCVTIAHRVGVWGFLELGDVLGPEYEGSGNNGLKDVVAALNWVRENIADFGGDPDQVTLGGLSSGAKNTCALMAAPAAEGLFHSAIVESGGAQTVHSLEDAQAIAARFMESSRMRGRSPRDLLSMSSRQLLAAQEALVDDYDGNFPFRAVVGGDFLSTAPLKAIRAGAGRDIRLLIGGTLDEAALFARGWRGNEPLEQDELSHIALPDAEALYDVYARAYPDDSDLDRRIRFLSAEEYGVPTMRVADARAAQADSAETYLYRFDWRGRDGRAPHAAEVTFAWNTADAADRAGLDDGAAPLQLHDMWARFIRGGSPAPLGGPEWPVYSAPDRRILVINEDFRVEPPDDRQLALWEGRL